jgi:hypothetical protein
MMRVRVGKNYVFDPVPLDLFIPTANIPLKKGDVVTVINLPSAPKANTMGMCYVAKNGMFAGMVMTNSLTPIPAALKRSGLAGGFS